MKACLLGLLLGALCLLPPRALAAKKAPAAPASTAASVAKVVTAALVAPVVLPATPPPPPPPPPDRVSVYLRGGGSLLVTPTRAMGGVGGGVGLRGVLKDRVILQVDVGYMGLLGNVREVRIGAGVQRGGTWSPSMLATVSVLRGDGLTLRTEGAPTSPRGPAGALAVVFAPFRFCSDRGSCVSLLEPGVGLGTDFATVGPIVHLGLLELGLAF
ncbi:hypothetical protein JRI60_03355 [Archangium violaceum]|uniref:hypothetical protein n=1 Tax=Archangium violaceum TaxID=83451 RepID=UPI00194E3E13|nr:hypothetical protein [Archangium violaceum]QRN98125.1 hypothetical protein JRI60_03355 [Archangium violaceum]